MSQTTLYPDKPRSNIQISSIRKEEQKKEATEEQKDATSAFPF